MKENATWNAPSEQEEKILALMLEVKNLKNFQKKDGPYKKDKPCSSRQHPKKDAKLSKSLRGSQKNRVRRTSTSQTRGTERPGGIVHPKWEANAPAPIVSTSQANVKKRLTSLLAKKARRAKPTTLAMLNTNKNLHKHSIKSA
jgi:hypothetical protein